MEWILLAAGVLIGWGLALLRRQMIGGWRHPWTPERPPDPRQGQSATAAPPRPVVKRREKPPDPEREKWEQILVNLERYDGTARGQCSITRRGNDN